MSKVLSLTVSKREVMGKKVSSLRKQGLTVGNMFSRGKESLAIQLDYEVMRKMYDTAGFNHPITLTVEGGSSHLVLIKQVDKDPRKNRISHVAFHEVDKNEKVEAEVPVELVGTSPAVLAGNIIITGDDTILVRANPMDLPDHLEVDATLLAEEDDLVCARDLKMPANVELADDEDKMIYRVEVPRSQVESEEGTSEADAVAATLAASGEVKSDE
jgi:large subunit ribosomal protein L25